MKFDLPDNLPDPERSYNNIQTFLEKNPDFADKLSENIYPVSMLFSFSQFLANYSINKPQSLFESLKLLDSPFDNSKLRTDLRLLLKECDSLKEGMRVIRNYKKDNLLVITLKDILKKSSLQEVTYELTVLADAILSESLDFVRSFLINRFGTPQNDTLVAIGLGKLGSYELNYSSDVDLIFAYRDNGETSGIQSPLGIITNRISTYEFYCKLIEEYTRFLSLNTEDGFAYRVDLRLRPQGQKGSLILSLSGYEEYYESWGQLWERAAMIRARPVAGEISTGEEFIRSLRPFIYRKYLGFDAIEEIRRLKTQVEQLKSGTLSKDIKRGFGGIREIEFFVQIFQLIYGGREPLLREGSTLMALHRLLQKAMIGYEDFRNLLESYIFLRTLENRLQQLNDLQTHTLPVNDKEIEILSKKMGFNNKETFLSALYSKRHKVRQIYDSLLSLDTEGPDASFKDKQPACKLMSSVFWEMDSPVESLLMEELSNIKLKEPRRAIQYLTKIRNSIYSFQTLKGRRLLENIIPKLVDEALRSSNPDNALLQLVDFSNILASRESYLESIALRQEIISTLTFIFSHSEYLSKILINSPEYIDSLIVGESFKKMQGTLRKDLDLLIEKHGISSSIRLFRKFEEIRLGVLFLNRRIGIMDLMRCISRTAETIILSTLRWIESNNNIQESMPLMQSHLFTVGFGKLGGREITFNSDIDFVFVCADEPTNLDIKIAEKLIRTISSYTKDGIAYKVDIRLRPDGSKGTLISSIEGFENYYLYNAHTWELQALLKARPLCREAKNNRLFIDMRKKVLLKRATEINKDEVKRMCGKIQKELSKESQNAKVYDIKHQTGGLLELEFFVQYLQLKYCLDNPDLLIQNTFYAIRMLQKKGLIEIKDAEYLKDTYLFYRTIETLIRLRNEVILKENSDIFEGIVFFLNTTGEQLLGQFMERRIFISNIWDRY